jgi:sec1 family domain-containing protein 1
VKGQKFSDVIVFMVGGGCYSEFYNLQELIKQKAGSGALRTVTYGCSELVSGDSFVEQLERLGAK